MNGGGAEIETQQRLINLYQLAGRSDEMIAEYETIIAAQPDEALTLRDIHANLSKPFGIHGVLRIVRLRLSYCIIAFRW